MTSRERLLKALNRETPDRVPINTHELAGFNSKAFENQEPSYRCLMEAIRARTDCIAMWNPQSNARFLESAWPVEMSSQTHREGEATITRTVIRTPKGDLTTTNKVIDRVHTTWRVERPCKSPADVDRALSVPYEPPRYDVSDYARIRAEVGDNGIIMSGVADALCLAAELMEMGEYTVWAMTETDHFARTIALLHERVMENLRRLLETRTADLVRIYGPEYATPPYLPPDFFRRFVMPQNRQMVELIHQYGVKCRIHCHGRIAKVLDMIAETGADALDPCEAPPDGDIALAEVKQRVGDRLCIFGNLQLKLLEHGSPEEVRAAVRHCMESAKAGGGYVIMPTASPINVPLSPRTEENYLTFIEAAHEYGRY